MIDPEILYQDENIVAINKPAGIAVHPDRVNERETIVFLHPRTML
jgi:23S rRNA-/tRNA-specific pseudouridylate synthase